MTESSNDLVIALKPWQLIALVAIIVTIRQLFRRRTA